MIRIPTFAALAIWILGAAPSGAATPDFSGTPYTLIVPRSSLAVGCQGPCDCAIQQQPTYGSFDLVPAGSDPLYTYFTVEHYIASFNNGPGAVAITGSGQYKMGGEFALVQQLTLDLQIEGGPAEHFDSGMKPLSAPFPQIDIACAVHGFYCFDSVLVVQAKPQSASVPPPGGGPPGFQRVQPNPFRASAEIAFQVNRPGSVELKVVDVTGRRVRTLARETSMPAGPHEVAWDGRFEDGRAAPAGLYWVRLVSPDGTDQRRLVKLD